MASARDDHISITSSESDVDTEYVVDAILTERLSHDSNTFYLVRWKNYPDERCTWEPPEHFLDPRILEEWVKTRNAGLQLNDDYIDSVIRKVEAYQDANDIKRSRRDSKHERLEERLPIVSIQSKLPETKRGERQKFVEGASTVTSTNVLKRKSFGVEERFPARVNPAPSSVFHGISSQRPERKSLHAGRTGEKLTLKTRRFRSLRHLNNARKAADREPTPDISKLELRAPVEWEEKSSKATEQPRTPRRHQFATSASDSAKPVDADMPHSTRHNPPEVLCRSKSKILSPKHVVAHDTTRTAPSSKFHLPQEFDPYGNQPKVLRQLANGRFFYHPGEFLVNMSFGRAPIGDVRISGIPPWSIGSIIRTKPQRGNLCLEIGSNDVVTLSQWAKLCTGRSNTFYTVGTVISYEDTECAVAQMEGYLWHHDLAALWYHPHEDIMLVFYSPRSSSWAFLERMGGLPIDSSIRVLTRNKMQSTEVLSLQDRSAEDVQVAVQHEGPRRSQLQNSKPSSSVQSLYNPFDGEVNSSATHDTGEEDYTGVGPDLNSNKFEFQLQPGQTVDDHFHISFQISYSYLTKVGISKTVDTNPAKARFFLAFPDSAKSELDHVKRFLKSHTFPTNICSTLEESGWEAFQNIFKGDYIGVILFHDDFTRYDKLPRLASFLRSSSPSVFRLSLSQPLKHCNEARHIERLFPSGMALLLTETALIKDGSTILSWFRQKRRAGSWKIILPPNIRKWLWKKAMHSDKEAMEKFDDLLNQLDILDPESSTARVYGQVDGRSSSSNDESIDGLSDFENEGGFVVSPSSIASYNRLMPPDETIPAEKWNQKLDKTLIEYFAGWSIANAESHRRFVALTPFTDDTSYYQKWGHIEVLTPEKFMRREGICKTPHTQPEISGPS